MSRPSAATPRDAALRVLRTLRDAGHQALFAGGCVRDMLLRRRPADYDVATDARPQQVIALFRRSQKVGVQFGVVIVGIGPHWVEVATFRRDEEYSDGRHPDRVQFCDAREDALRRDFTINGMFYDPLARRVIDYVGGRDDLRAGVLRAIGDPQRRFAEDHLRMLRAVRFAARFGYRIDPATRAAIVAGAAATRKVSPERVLDELTRMLTHPSRAAGWEAIVETGLVDHLWPRSEALRENHRAIAARLAALPQQASLELALACLLLEQDAGAILKATRDLRTSNETRDALAWLCKQRPRLDTPLTLAELKRLMAGPRFGELVRLFEADLVAQGATGRRPGGSRAVRLRFRLRRSPPPLVTGDDLKAWQVPQGPLYRRLLDRVYDAQLNGDVTKRDAALALARSLLPNGA